MDSCRDAARPIASRLFVKALIPSGEFITTSKIPARKYLIVQEMVLRASRLKKPALDKRLSIRAGAGLP
jgi:hypothetical protein